MVELNLVVTQFRQCLAPDSDVKLDFYIAAYEEINKIFACLGTVFKFVSTDVTNKISILKRKLAEHSDEYATVSTMIDHETAFQLTISDRANGCRTLLRLHRALEFIAEFLSSLVTTDGNNISGPVWKAYNTTLAQYHGWIIKKTVGAAMYTLPHKPALLSTMGGPSACDMIPELVDVIRQVHDAVQRLYVQHNLLELK